MKKTQKIAHKEIVEYFLVHSILSAFHCESREWLWEVALQTHSLRDAEPQQVITLNTNKSHGLSPKQLRPVITISLTSTDPGLPRPAWQSSVGCYFRRSQLGTRNVTDKLCSLFLCAWLLSMLITSIDS